MPWQLASILHVLLASFRSIQNRKIGLYKKDLSIYALVVSFIGVLLMGLGYAVFNWELVNHSSAWSARYFLLVGGMLFGSLNLLNFKLFRLLPASIVAIISLLSTLSVVILSMLFANERLSGVQISGGVLILSSILIVALITNGNNNKSKLKIYSALVIALIIALMYGPAIVNEKYLIDRIGLETYLLYGWGLQSLSAFTIAFMLRKPSKLKTTVKMHVNVWIYGMILAISGMLFIQSLVESDSASLAIIGASAKVVFTVFLAFLILKERSNLKLKIFSTVLSSIGLFLLFS